VHLRRALLLFAIVLGVAALAASLSRPLDERTADRTAPQPRPPGPATVTPAPAPAPAPNGPKLISFDTAKNESKRMRAGDAATLEVSVSEGGTVEIADMGLSAAADPFTPARFDVFPTKPGRYPVRFVPAGNGADEPAGTLVVTSAG
jgi:hypothetical protein